MTKDQYNLLKTELMNKYGPAEYDLGSPVNESARKLAELRSAYRIERIHDAAVLRAKKKEESVSLKDIAAKIKTDNRNVKSIPIDLSKHDLAPFNEKECKILEIHFDNLNLTNKQIGERSGVSTSFVTALFGSAAYKVLYAKVFDRILPIESLNAIREAMKAGDSKVTLEVARHYKLIQNEQLDLNTQIKPIQDSALEKKLREIGDGI